MLFTRWQHYNANDKIKQTSRQSFVLYFCLSACVFTVISLQPMLLQVRLHPLLVTATKDKELMRERSVGMCLLPFCSYLLRDF